MSSLWEKGVHVSFDKIQYYVKDLMPPLSISTVECGSKLRRLSTIPGRDVSIYEATPSKSEHVSDIAGKYTFMIGPSI